MSRCGDDLAILAGTYPTKAQFGQVPVDSQQDAARVHPCHDATRFTDLDVDLVIEGVTRGALLDGLRERREDADPDAGNAGCNLGATPDLDAHLRDSAQILAQLRHRPAGSFLIAHLVDVESPLHGK